MKIVIVKNNYMDMYETYPYTIWFRIFGPNVYSRPIAQGETRNLVVEKSKDIVNRFYKNTEFSFEEIIEL